MGKGNAGRKAAMKRRWDDAKTSGQATLANETKYTPRPEEEDDDFEPGTPLPARAIPALSLPAAGAGHGQGRCSSRATRAPDGWLAARAPLSRRIPLRHCRARRGVALPFPRPQLSPNPCPAARQQTTRRTGSPPAPTTRRTRPTSGQPRPVGRQAAGSARSARAGGQFWLWATAAARSSMPSPGGGSASAAFALGLLHRPSARRGAAQGGRGSATVHTQRAHALHQGRAVVLLVCWRACRRG